ncbi:conjugative transfer protein TraD [Legionella beliardensis]|uniref:Conjugative transfer protein TraD n=1 Tax=Legionella beliardensis TaxID=91822 RepID=A0A378JR59_9GAMM|nr:type IV conjugative transfer system coupling protein TraD [Legionella beliardensis]STX55681.1 conjugative transfer protein TraD [Legionella beliardensis]
MSKEPNFKHYTRGGQISFHNLRMWDQITKTLSLICLFLWIIFTAFLTWLFIPLEKITHTAAFYYAHFLRVVGQNHIFELSFHGKTYKQTVDSILHYPYYQDTANQVINSLGKSAFWAFCFSFILGLGLASYFIKRGKTQSASQFVRGSQLQNATEVKKKIFCDKAHSDITIDKFPLIKDSEVQHVLVHGTVGTGKSQLIMKIMDCLRKRGDRVIVYDKGCSFIPHYYQNELDVILNPFDKRCANWDMWLEAPRDSDFENMAESAIPMHGESDPFWVNASRTVFSCLSAVMRHHPERSLEKFLKLILTDEFSALEEHLQGTPAATLVSGKIEKTAISIRATLTTYLKSFSALAELNQEGKKPFSIRDYILDEQQKGWLFISSNGETHKSLKPLISMWLAQASLALLSLAPDRSRRIWFICDELPSLHKLPLLGETIAEVRKFGGCFLLGMQSFSQLTKVYGQAGAKEIFDLLNTRFFFRSPSAEMARLVASELGEEEIEESRENYSYGANSIRDGISLGSQRVTRPIVSYPQIMELKDLHCFVRLPGHYPITALSLDLGFRATKDKGFIERSMPAAFNFSQLAPFEDNLESEVGDYMGSKTLTKNKIDAEYQNIEELNLEPL